MLSFTLKIVGIFLVLCILSSFGLCIMDVLDVVLCPSGPVKTLSSVWVLFFFLFFLSKQSTQ